MKKLNSKTKFTPAICTAFAGCLLLTSCGDKTGAGDTGAGTENPKSGKLEVAAVNYPLFFFASAIGGESISVYFPKIEGDPAFFKPSDEQVGRYQNADLILRNGANYAKWAGKVSLPESTQINTGKAFEGALIEVEEAVTHTHGDGETHSHAGVAFTTWLDFENARFQSGAIANAFAQKLPEKSGEIGERLTKLHAELDSIDAELIEISQKLNGKPLVASHPVYQYLAKAYGLKIESVHWEPETVPDAEGIAELEKILATHPAKIMLWEDKPAVESVEKLNALGIQSIVFNPCGNRPETGDFLSTMKENLANLRGAID